MFYYFLGKNTLVKNSVYDTMGVQIMSRIIKYCIKLSLLSFTCYLYLFLLHKDDFYNCLNHNNFKNY